MAKRRGQAPPDPPPSSSLTTKYREIAAKAAGFQVSDERILSAWADFGGWEPTVLKNDCDAIVKEMTRLNPSGRITWPFIHSMMIVIALREAGYSG